MDPEDLREVVQDAAYSTLLRSRRHQLHGHITVVLETHFPEIVQTQPDVLARHSAEVALPEKAVGYCVKAGQQAMARWARRIRANTFHLTGLVPDARARD
jgi:predicted ATPase